jgi:hypothetical protein
MPHGGRSATQLTLTSIALVAFILIGRLAAGQTTLTRVSVDAAAVQATGASGQPSSSVDGRYIAFASRASNLVPGDTNASSDVFVKDRQAGAISRVSVRTGGAEAGGDSVAPHISADGRYVTFVSYGALVAEDSAPCGPVSPSMPTCSDIYVHDRVTGATTRESVAIGNAQANAHSVNPHISGDGRFVVFESGAANLVGGDTNGVDVFLRDRQTALTTRVSVATDGAQGIGGSSSSTISDDGGTIAFLSTATALDPSADPLRCADLGFFFECTRVFVHQRTTGVTTRLALDPVLYTQTYEAYRVARATVSRDGNAVALVLDAAKTSGPTAMRGLTTLAVHSLVTGRTKNVNGVSSTLPVLDYFVGLGVDATARSVATCFKAGGGGTFVVSVFDTSTGLQTQQGLPGAVIEGAVQLPDCDPPALSGDSNLVFLATSASTLVTGDTNAAKDVIVLDQDVDDDGMSSVWESTFGLNFSDAADAALDADSDGLTALQEFQAASHPRGLFKRYLAEGAENAFFSTTIDAFNPGAATATVVARFLGQNGVATSSAITTARERVTGTSLVRISPDRGNLPDQAFSTVIESDQLLAVERTMTWGGGLGVGYGSHAETAVASPSTTWYFAEGATHGQFDLFYLLQNPSSVDAAVTITYLRPAPQAPVVVPYTVPANSRRTIYVDQVPELAATDVSARIDADRPIFAERALYRSRPGVPFAAGTNGAGLTAPALQWFVAEGATGTFFDLFILIGNPSAQAAAVTVTWLLPDGASFDKIYEVAPQARLTISVDGEDVRLAATSVGATVRSTNSVPIVVERAMWWPSPDWYEGSLTAATTDTAQRWALAGGLIGAAPEFETYLLVTNPGDTAANVTIDIGQNGLPGSPALPNVFGCRVVVPVAARGRFGSGLKSLCPSASLSSLFPTRVAGTIESDGPGIVVERATYWSTPGEFWAAGATTLLTKLP